MEPSVSAGTVSESLTRSVEDYLKAIYQLSPEGRPASTSEIAHLLALSPPSVTGMVKRLSEHGLLDHIPYRGVQLTGEGRRAALRMIRRHRLLRLIWSSSWATPGTLCTTRRNASN